MAHDVGRPNGETLASQFAALWQRPDGPPDLAEFLRSHSTAPLRDRAEVVRVDQRRRWALGRPRPLEDYFRDHPELGGHPEVRSALTAAEYRSALKHGRAPDLESFLAAHPDLPALRERIGPVAAPTPAPVADEIYSLAAGDPDPANFVGGNDRVGDVELGALLPQSHELAAAVSPLIRPPHPLADESDIPASPRQPPRNWAGRRLAARARQWDDDPTLGALPLPWEWVAIVAGTRRADWTRRQRAVMVAATKFQAVLLAVLLAVVGAGTWVNRLVTDYRSLGDFGPELAANDPAAVKLYAEQLKAASIDAHESRLGRLDTVPQGLRGWEWHHLRLRGPIPPILPQDASSVSSVQFSPDGDLLAIVGATARQGKAPPERSTAWSVRLPEGRPLVAFGGDEPIARLVFSRDGSRLAVVFADGSLSVTTVGVTSTVLPRLPASSAEGERAADVALDPRSSAVLFVASDGKVRAWDATGPGPARVVGESHPRADRLVVTPDGRRYATSGGGRFTLWDAETKTKLAEAGAERDATPANLVLSPDGALVAALTSEGIGVWAVGDGKPVARWSGTVQGADRLAFDPASKRLASAVPDGVRLRDLSTDKDVRTLSGQGVVWPVAGGISFQADGRRLSAAGRTWDLDDGKEVAGLDHGIFRQFAPRGPYSATLAGNSVLVREEGRVLPRSVLNSGGAASPDGKRLVTVFPGNGITEIDSGTQTFETGRIGIPYYHLAAWRPDALQFATADAEGEVRLWDARSVTPTAKFRLKSVQALFYTADSKRLLAVVTPQGERLPETASLTIPRAIAAFDPATGAELGAVGGGYYQLGLRVALSPNSRLLASGSVHKTVRVHDLRSGWVRRTFEGHTGAAVAVAFSPNGRLLASSAMTDRDGLPDVGGSGPNGETILWDLPGNRAAHTLPGAAFGVAFSPDGQRLATAGYREVTLWDVSTGIKLMTLPVDDSGRPWKSLSSYNFTGNSIPVAGVWSIPITFSADGGRLLLSGRKFQDRDWQKGDNIPVKTTVWRSRESESVSVEGGGVRTPAGQ